MIAHDRRFGELRNAVRDTLAPARHQISSVAQRNRLRGSLPAHRLGAALALVSLETNHRGTVAQYPQNCVCYLEVGEKSPGQRVLPGTGWIARAANGLVCTSGHNLHRPGFTPGWVHVWVDGDYARSGSKQPATRWHVHPGWKQGFHWESDLAVIEAGDLRPFGAFRFANRAQVGLPIEVTGFAAIGSAARRRLHGTIAALSTDFIGYPLPTKRGMSGGPVWALDDEGRPIVVGMHSRKGGQAVRLTDAHVGWIKGHS